jgi:hypothetical protein
MILCVRYEAAKEESQIAYCLDLYNLDAGIRSKGHTNAPAFLLAVARQYARSSQSAGVSTASPAAGDASRAKVAVWLLSLRIFDAPVLLIRLLVAVKDDLTKARKRPPPDQVGSVSAFQLSVTSAMDLFACLSYIALALTVDFSLIVSFAVTRWSKTLSCFLSKRSILSRKMAKVNVLTH